MDEKLNLNWHTFSSHMLESIGGIYHSQEYTDVTLICDDYKQLKAHKFVLGSCSQVFRNILRLNTQKHPTIILRGIVYQDMESILQFMYLGKSTFEQDRMGKILSAAKTLEVLEISDCYNESQENIETNFQEQVPSNSQRNNHKSVIVENHEAVTKTFESTLPSLAETVNLEKIFNGSRVRVRKCPECGDEVKRIKKHFNTKHPTLKFELTYECSQCEKVFKSRGHLKTHYESKHTNIRYECDLCDKSFTTKSVLNSHIKLSHYGEKFKCEYKECKREFNQKSYLIGHVESVHKGNMFKCDECNYETTSTTSLITHKLKHQDKVKCPQCENSYSRQAIKTHIKLIHENRGYKYCEYEGCEKRYREAIKLAFHVSVFHEGKTICCQDCDLPFKSSSSLYKHKRLHHRHK